MKQRVLACLLAAALLLTLSPAVSAAAYADVPADHWAAAEIDAATSAGLFEGVSEDAFGLGRTINRAQFVTALCRLFGWEMESGEAHTFTDCPSDAWYYAAVETAYQNGALPTYSTTFRPYDAITREEMASMLVRALGYSTLAGQLSEEELPYGDVTSNRGYIAIASDLGIFSGYDDGTFRPRGLATREQAAAVMVRLYTRLQSESISLSSTGGYTVLSVETPEPSAETAVPATPLDPLPELYAALKSCRDSGADLGQVVVVLKEGGVATTTRGSSILSSETISQSEVEGYLRRSGVETYTHSQYACDYLTYTSGNTQTTVWYQSEENVAEKLELCRLFGVTHYCMEPLA